MKSILIDKEQPHRDSLLVIEIRKTKVFAHWLDGLRDIQARAGFR